MVTTSGNCSLAEKCEHKLNPRCYGCGFQHFDEVHDASSNNEVVKALWSRYFELVQRSRRSTGSRIPLDEVLRDWLEKKTGWVMCQGDELRDRTAEHDIPFKAKCDACFRKKDGRYVLLEVKGYGMDTNSILSAITAAMLVSNGKKFGGDRSAFYYLSVGVGSRGGTHHAIGHSDFAANPYVTWAEKHRFISFIGLPELDRLVMGSGVGF